MGSMVSRFRVECFEGGSTNFYFLEDKYLAEKFYANLLLIFVDGVSTQIRIFKQPRFQYKHNFMKLITSSVVRAKYNQIKLITDSESTKINVRSGCAFSLILHMSAVIYKQRFSMETRLRNIFKTTKVIILTNTIIESPYKILLDSSKRKALTWPI